MNNEQYTPNLEKPEPLGELLEINPIINNTDQFQFPFRLSSLPRLLAYSTDSTTNVNLASRTITEGRAYSLPPVIFRKISDMREIKFMDLSVKGGGSEIKPNTELFINIGSERFPEFDKSSPIPVTIQIEGETIQVRYHPQKLVSLTSNLGVHAYNSGMADHYMSMYLEEKGLRTRSLVAAWELSGETKMATPNGIVNAEKFQNETGVKPGLEIWASRCKYRVQDILRFVYEMEHASKNKSKSEKLPTIGVPRRKYDPERGLPNHKQVDTDFEPKLREKAISELTVLAQEIKLRASQDSDQNFVELSQKFRDKITIETVEDFYIEYLQKFGQVLGEQFAILEKNDALFGMFNLQNITLLAEIVDHDTTMIRGNVMNSEGDLVPVSAGRFRRFAGLSKNELNFEDQLFVGYDCIMSMIVSLGRTGVINADEEKYKEIRQLFLKSYLTSLSKKRQSLLYRYAYLKIEDMKQSASTEKHDPYSEHIEQTFMEDVLSLTKWAGWDQTISTEEAIKIGPKSVTESDTVSPPDKNRQRLVDYYLNRLMDPNTAVESLRNDHQILRKVLSHIKKGEATSEYNSDEIQKKLEELGIG